MTTPAILLAAFRHGLGVYDAMETEEVARRTIYGISLG